MSDRDHGVQKESPETGVSELDVIPGGRGVVATFDDLVREVAGDLQRGAIAARRRRRR